MNRDISLPRRALLTALLTVSLVGAGSVAAAPAQAAGAHTFSTPLTGGGAFTSTFGGIFTFIGCPSGLNCTLVLTGGGPATFLGTSRDTTVISLTGLSLPCVQVGGSSVLTSTATSGDAVTANISGTLCLRNPPIKGLRFSLNYIVTGGTGTYSGASGSGTITGVVIFNRTYFDAWKGTLIFP